MPAKKSSSSSSRKKSTARKPAARIRKPKVTEAPAFPGLETRDALVIARERPEPVDPLLAARG